MAQSARAPLFPLLAWCLLAGPASWAGQAPRLISPSDLEAHCQRPVWGPEGQLAFEVAVSAKRKEQFLLPSLDAKPLKLSPKVGSRFSGPVDQVCHEISFGPAGSARAVMSCGDRASMGYRLVLVEVLGGAVNTTLVSSGQGNDGWPAWRPGHASQVLFTSGRTGKGDVYLMDLSSPDSPERRTKGTSTEDFASWSPQGNMFLFVQRTSARGGEGVMLVSPANGGRTRALADWPESDETNPSWSPDGKSVAFYSNKGMRTRKDELPIYDLYVADLAGKAVKVAQGVMKADGMGPAWAPDGRSLVVVRHDAKEHNPLVRVDLDSRKAKVIATDTLMHSDVAVARAADGSVLMAFTAQGRGADKVKRWRRLYLMALE